MTALESMNMSSTLSTIAIVTTATTHCVLHGSNVKLEYAVKDMSSLLTSMYEFRYVSLDKQPVPYILSFFQNDICKMNENCFEHGFVNEFQGSLMFHYLHNDGIR